MAVLGEEPTGHPLFLCGFEYAMPFGAPIEFGVECNALLL